MSKVVELRPIDDTDQVPHKEDLDVRVLTPDEVESLRSIFVEQRAVFPNTDYSFIVGAVEPGGRVVAFLCFQLQLHAEPMHIEPKYQHVFKRLIDVGEKTLLERVGPCLVYTFTPAGKITQLAQAAGMQMEPWVVMSKLVSTPEKEVV
jgi:hypothetical protein